MVARSRYACKRNSRLVGMPTRRSQPGVQSDAPVLRGTRMPVNAIVDNFDYGVNVAEIAQQFEVPADSVEAILTYAKSRRARVHF